MGFALGDIIYFNVLGSHIMVLNSMEAVTDLFEKRSNIYSSRTKSVMFDELMDASWSFVLMPYGDRWRRTRRAFHQYFNQGAVENYKGLQIKEVRDFLKRLAETPDDLFHHIRQCDYSVSHGERETNCVSLCSSFASTIMKLVYDADIQDTNDPYIDIAEKALSAFTIAAQPGAFLVDMIPISKFHLCQATINRTCIRQAIVYSEVHPCLVSGSLLPEACSAKQILFRRNEERSFRCRDRETGKFSFPA